MATVTRGKIGRSDMALFDGVNTTFNRKDATGGTIVQLREGDDVDVLQVYGNGTSRTRETIGKAIRSIGSNNATLRFSPGSWVIDDDLTIPSNLTVFVKGGAVFNVASGKTLTISGRVITEHDTWYTGTVSATNTPDTARNAGNVINFGADASGTLDSTAAFQAAVDSLNIVYVPQGDFRIDGNVELKRECIIEFERGLMPNIRTWQDSDDAPRITDVGIRCRLFKDDSSTDTDFFTIRWGRVDLLGFPLIDVSEVTSFTSAGVLFDVGSANDYSGDDRPRIGHNTIEISCLGNVTTIGNDGEGINPIEVSFTSDGTTNGYLYAQNWYVQADLVNTVFKIPSLASGASQFANTITGWVDVDGCKQVVYNYAANTCFWYGTVQARNVLNVNERGKAAFEIGAEKNEIKVIPYDLNTDVQSNGSVYDGNYRMNLSLKNEGYNNMQWNLNANNLNNVGHDPSCYMLPHLNSPRGFVPFLRRRAHDNNSGLVQSALYNEWQNADLRASSFGWEVYQGISETSTAVSDAVFANASNSSVDITSAGGNLPTYVVGERFEVQDHSDSNNNGECKVTAVITDGYTVDFYNTNVIPATPANATSEAITVVHGYGAMVSDSGTEGISTSSDYTEQGDLDDAFSSYGDFPAIKFNSTAVADGDYLEYHFTGLLHACGKVYISLYSNGGFTTAQVVRKLSGVVVDNEIVSCPNQKDEDPAGMIRLNASDTNADEVIIRLIGPRDTTKAYSIADICAADTDISANAGHFISKRGGQTILGSLDVDGRLDANAGLVIPSYTTTQIEQDTHAVNTSNNKVAGYVVRNSTTGALVVANGDGPTDTWTGTDGTTHTPT